MSDLATLQARRASVQDAYNAALKAQETQQGTGTAARRLVRADFAALAQELATLDAQISALTPRRRVFYVR